MGKNLIKIYLPTYVPGPPITLPIINIFILLLIPQSLTPDTKGRNRNPTDNALPKHIP